MRDLLPISLAKAHLILRQQMPAVTVKWKEATWVKTATLLALGEINFPSHNLVPCSDLAWAAGGWSPRWGVGAVLQYIKSSRHWELQEEGEQIFDAVAGRLKHLSEPVPSSKVHFCSVSLKCLLFVAQTSIGHGEFMPEISLAPLLIAYDCYLP